MKIEFQKIEYKKTFTRISITMNGKSVVYRISLAEDATFSGFLRDVYFVEYESMSDEAMRVLAKNVNKNFLFIMEFNEAGPDTLSAYRDFLMFPHFIKALIIRKTIELQDIE